MSEAYEARVNSNRAFNESQPNLFSNNDDFEDLDDDFLDIYTMNPRQRMLHQLRKIRNKAIDYFQKLSTLKKILVILAVLLQLTLTIVILIFHNQILKAMITASNELRARWYTPLIFMALVFAVSFPPLIGFSMLSIMVGIIYGISFLGWFILFTGSVGGSISAFVLFKTLLRSQAERLVHANAKFEALTSTLQDDDSYWMLSLIRLCPFPYSFTNGAIAGIYGVSLRNFSLASALTSPKLLMYLFIGSRLKSMGETSSTSSRLFDIGSIIVTGLILALTTWILYTRARKRYLELQRNQSLDVSFETVF
ncbi:LANO_0H24234g1_1 [Lachancea nothofagi CBS 11611]|uniref:Golgi apparatus membrane protein TVP38 n=1 Tax=Lachancea nothofagi CBS 11611 TaxID=1266666 RepID=A0A1G4KNS1_9SACH|nr:LANO_0H24234g1_1 [Lachancea nothofagi CBS 11611]